MLARLVLKILFKACLPLVAVFGIMSYMFYLQGGNPGAVLSKVIGGIAGKARQSVQQAGQSLDSIKPGEESSISEVHTWVDEYGVTHYSSRAPVDAQSTTLRVNSNANVVTSTPMPKPESEPGSELGSEPTQTGGLKGLTIPGSGGLKMPVNLNRKELTEFLEQAQRPSTER